MKAKLHILHFGVLLAGLLIGVMYFYIYRYDRIYQFYAVVLSVAYYVLWGILHHYLEDRFDFHIILEYVLIGGVVTLLFALVLGI